jgi:general secretion pathway protein M
MKFNFKALSKREIYTIYFASIVICILFLIEFIAIPVVDKKNRLERILQVKIKTLEDMTVLKSEYDHIRLKNKEYKSLYGKKEKGFTLFSFLEKHADQTGIKDHITYMKPSSSVQKNINQKVSSVEMELKDITLNQLVSYLHAVESNEKNIIISKISVIKTGAGAGFINSILHVDAFEVVE